MDIFEASKQKYVHRYMLPSNAYNLLFSMKKNGREVPGKTTGEQRYDLVAELFVRIKVLVRQFWRIFLRGAQFHDEKKFVIEPE